MSLPYVLIIAVVGVKYEFSINKTVLNRHRRFVCGTVTRFNIFSCVVFIKFHHKFTNGTLKGNICGGSLI